MCSSLKSSFPLPIPCSQDWQCLWLLEVIHFPLTALGALDYGFGMDSAEDTATKLRGGIQILLDGGIHISPTVCCLLPPLLTSFSACLLSQRPQGHRSVMCTVSSQPVSISVHMYICIQSIAGLMIGVLDDSPPLLETTLS